MSASPKSAKVRIVRKPVHGLLLLDKPLGLSSNDALQKAKWLLRAEKAGHTGTLDPLATGVLPLCFGAATKFSQLQLDADKTYLATMRLGTTTTTGDAEGDVVLERAVACTWQDFKAVLLRFLGLIGQTPPMYSALKRDGKPLYEYARAGITLERETRQITIHSIDFDEEKHFVQHPSAQSAIEIIVKCSKGTYIRTLAEDVGEALGCGAHLIGLRRVDTGGLNIDRCVTLAQLENLSEADRLACLLPTEILLATWPQVSLDTEEAGRFLTGLRRKVQHANAAQVAVFGTSPRAFLGSAHVVAGELIPTRLLSPKEISESLLASS